MQTSFAFFSKGPPPEGHPAPQRPFFIHPNSTNPLPPTDTQKSYWQKKVTSDPLPPPPIAKQSPIRPPPL